MVTHERQHEESHWYKFGWLNNALFRKKKREHPIFTEGKSAFYNGLEILNNPYKADVDCSSKWEAGYKEASKARVAWEKDSKAMCPVEISTNTNTTHEVDTGLSTAYIIVCFIIGAITFIGCWIYAIASWGFLLGVGLGWMPSVFIAVIAAVIWPLLVLLLLIGLGLLIVYM